MRNSGILAAIRSSSAVSPRCVVGYHQLAVQLRTSHPSGSRQRAAVCSHTDIRAPLAAIAAPENPLFLAAPIEDARSMRSHNSLASLLQSNS